MPVTGGTNDTTALFYIAEITASKPGTATFTFQEGHGTTPVGTFSQFSDTVSASTAEIRASDLGYRTSPLVDGDPQSYPPVLIEGFAIDRRINLDPSQPSVAAAWGSLQISNADGRFDSLVSNWTNDGQPIEVCYGYKQLENFQGSRNSRSTTGTYIDPTNVMQTAPALQLRDDWTGGVSRVLNEPAATNLVLTSESGSVFNTNGNSTVATSTAVSSLNGTATIKLLTLTTTTGANKVWTVFATAQTIGLTYTASVWMWIPSGQTQITNSIFFGEGGTSGSAAIVAPNITKTNQWQRVSCNWVATTTSGSAVLRAFFIGNLLRNSNAITTSPWLNRTTPTFTSGQTAPDGTTTAWLIQNNGTIAALRDAYQDILAADTTTNTTYTFSVYAKDAGNGWLHLMMRDFNTVNAGNEAWFNLATGVKGSVANLGTGSGTTSTMTSVGSGWYRCTVTGIITTISTPNPFEFIIRMSIGNNDNGPTGVATNGTYVWHPQAEKTTTASTYIDTPTPACIAYVTCPQVELGSSSTSYIPTTGATASRAADLNYASRGIFLDPPYTSVGNILRGIQAPWFLSDTALQVPIRDATYWLSRPVQTQLYQGTGGLQGTANLTGAPVPITRGGFSGLPVRNIQPLLIDPTRLVYQYTDLAGTVEALYEGGALTITRQADVADLYTGTTNPGQFRTCNAKGLFQLGSTPQAQITADVTGQFAVAGLQFVLIEIVLYLLTEQLLIPAANINTAHFIAMATAFPYVGGIHFASNDSPDGVTAMDRLLSGMNAKLIPYRDGTLRILMLRAPSGTPVAAFGTDNVVSVIPQALPATLDPPIYRARVSYSHNYTVQTSGLLGSATATQRQFASIADNFASASNSTILANYVRPNDLAPISSAMTSSGDSVTVANAIVALWATRRRLYQVTMPIALGLARELGDLVQLIWPMDNLFSGQLGIIVGEQFRSEDAQITFQVLV